MINAIENISIVAIIVAVSIFILLIIILYFEEKFTTIKNAKSTERLKNFLFVVMFLCIPIVVISILIEWASQPSAYEKCMQGVNGQWDDNAIAWLEDYCYSNS